MGWVVNATPLPICLQEIRYPFYRTRGGLRGRSGRIGKISLSPGLDPPIIEPTGSRCTEYVFSDSYSRRCCYFWTRILESSLALRACLCTRLRLHILSDVTVRLGYGLFPSCTSLYCTSASSSREYLLCKFEKLQIKSSQEDWDGQDK
jgi:hypothetical protein